MAIRSPMYWECRNRHPRANLHMVLASTMAQITAILFCLCDWQLSGLRPLTREKRARQYGVSSESCRHWLKQSLTPVTVATNLIVYWPMLRIHRWNNVWCSEYIPQFRLHFVLRSIWSTFSLMAKNREGTTRSSKEPGISPLPFTCRLWEHSRENVV